MEKLFFKSFLQTRQGKKIKKQIKTAHDHQRAFLRLALSGIEMPLNGYLAVDDKGEIVMRIMVPGQGSFHEEREAH